MKYKKEIQQIDEVIKQLRALKSDLTKASMLSDNAYKHSVDRDMKKGRKASTDLNFHLMGVDKQRQVVWQSIVDADLEIDLEKREYNPTEFHTYK